MGAAGVGCWKTCTCRQGRDEVVTGPLYTRTRACRSELPARPPTPRRALPGATPLYTLYDYLALLISRRESDHERTPSWTSHRSI